MTTKREFVEMWNNGRNTVKKIRFFNGDAVFADHYIIGDNFVDLDLHNITYGVFKIQNIKRIESD